MIQIPPASHEGVCISKREPPKLGSAWATELPAARFDPRTSRTAVRHATARPLRPASVFWAPLKGFPLEFGIGAQGKKKLE